MTVYVIAGAYVAVFIKTRTGHGDAELLRTDASLPAWVRDAPDGIYDSEGKAIA